MQFQYLAPQTRCVFGPKAFKRVWNLAIGVLHSVNFVIRTIFSPKESNSMVLLHRKITLLSIQNETNLGDKIWSLVLTGAGFEGLGSTLLPKFPSSAPTRLKCTSHTNLSAWWIFASEWYGVQFRAFACHCFDLRVSLTKLALKKINSTPLNVKSIIIRLKQQL